MQRFVEIAKTGLTAILLHPVRSTMTFCALLAILVPYLAGMGVAKGVQQDAESSLRAGGDLYVSSSQFGRSTPIPLSLVEEVRELVGVTDVVPRIVGRLTLGRELVEVVLVGIPESRFPTSITCVDGRLPRAGSINEFVIGTELARELKLKPGSLLPPFYRNPRGEHVSKIVGIFRSDVSLWQSNLMFSTFETAEEIFNQEGMATDLVVDCQSGYETNVSRAIRRMTTLTNHDSANTMQLKVTSREELNLLLAGGQLHREGVFNLHFLLVFVIGILVILVTSGLGLPERRREIGILKATGWQTDEILLRSLVESLLFSVGGASVSILVAFVWLKLFNGYFIAGIFIAGVALVPSFEVPFRLTPVPAVLAFIIALVVTMSGSLWSTWRSAIAPPDEAMR
jgi:ABC-type lipoprotein release transport system permease subunit